MNIEALLSIFCLFVGLYICDLCTVWLSISWERELHVNLMFVYNGARYHSSFNYSVYLKWNISGITIYNLCFSYQLQLVFMQAVWTTWMRFEILWWMLVFRKTGTLSLAVCIGAPGRKSFVSERGGFERFSYFLSHSQKGKFYVCLLQMNIWAIYSRV
jgi:hypothetical protein